MKKLLLFLIFAFAAININAQLKVDSDGKIRLQNQVAIGSSGFNFNAGLQTFSTQTTGTYYGIHSKVMAYSIQYGTRSFTGLCGQIQNQSSINLSEGSDRRILSSFLAGVAGVAQTGVGIYGATGTSLPETLLGSYAGYFSGNVKITGTLTVPTSLTSSDQRLKTNISDITSQTNSLLYNLRPVSYKFNENDTIHFRYDSDAQELKNTHFGLIAQELKEVYPNLVYENEGDGYLSVNYIELIPLLIGTIQEQNERISALESQLSQDNSSAQKQVAAKNSVVAKLYQNNPNPFNQSTVINYDLPLETNNANLYIYDMTGTQIAAYNLTEFGSGSITISAGELNAGMYLYSLIADGQLVDTKQMILTK